MAADDSAPTAERDFIETLYGDPIRPSAARAARNLLIASLLLIAVVKFGAQIQSTSMFPISFKQPDVLPTVLSVIVGFLTLNFLARILMEIGLFLESERRIKSYIWKVKVDASVAAAHDIDDGFSSQQEEEGDPSLDPWWEDVGEIREAAKKAEEAIEKRLGRNAAVRLVRSLRALGEVLVPLSFALASLVLSAPRWHWPS
jgi:hypothetical protein